MAQEAAAAKPNLYELSGDGIKIVYTLQPLAGPPQFNYDDGKLSNLFTGKDIRTEETEVGTVVSVTIHLDIDRGSTSFSVLIPRVNLADTTSASITTMGITTVHHRPVVGPPPPGQDDLYTVRKMTGMAKFVLS